MLFGRTSFFILLRLFSLLVYSDMKLEADLLPQSFVYRYPESYGDHTYLHVSAVSLPQMCFLLQREAQRSFCVTV